MRFTAALLVLAGCYAPPHHVLGAWNRISSDGVAVPPAPIDRLTFWYEGDVLEQRGGGERRGTFEEQWTGEVTIRFGAEVTSWRASRPGCPDRPATCLRLRSAAHDDLFRGPD